MDEFEQKRKKKSTMKIFDRIEAECEKLMKQDGRTPQAFYLGKREWIDFVEELLDLQETPDTLKSLGRQKIAESDIIINDDVRVIPTDRETEFRVEAKGKLFN